MVPLARHPRSSPAACSPSLWVSQGYPQALLPLTVAGIPSIHICLDFIPELLAQPQLEKQVNPPSRSLPRHGARLSSQAVRPAALFFISAQIFAIQLLSQLCTQYALPKSLSVARLAVSVMGTLLTGECRTFCLLCTLKPPFPCP